MKLLSYKYFVAVAEELSFSRAAKSVHISQSALSRQIRLLEEDLGVLLFDRIGRRIELTRAGQDLLARSRALLKDAEELGNRAKSFAEGVGGVLRVGATPQTLESVLASFLPDFNRRHPGIQIELIEDGSARLEHSVAHGSVDLAVGGLSPGSLMEGRHLFPLGTLALVPDDSKLFGRSEVEFTDLSKERILLLQTQFMTRQIFDGICQVANIRPRVVLESSSPHCLLALVQARHGVAIVPSSVLLGELRKNAVPVTYQGRQLGFDMCVIWDPRRYFSPAARLFVDELATATEIDFPGKSFGFQMSDMSTTTAERFRD